MLVRGVLQAPVGTPEAGEIHPFAGCNHGGGPAGNLGAVHAVEQDGHVQGSHLLIRDGTAGVGVDGPVDLFRAQRPFVPLGADDVDGVESLGLAVRCAGVGHRVSSRCSGPKASGSTWSMVLMPWVVMSCRSGCRNSYSNWRHRPQGMRTFPAPSTQ